MDKKKIPLSHVMSIIWVAHPTKREALKEALKVGRVIIADDTTLEGRAVLHQCERYKVPCIGKSQIFELPGGSHNEK